MDEVSSRDVPPAIGYQAGEAGSLMATDTRTAFTRLCEAMQNRGVISAEVARDLIQASSEEVRQHLMYTHITFAWGRKPS